MADPESNLTFSVGFVFQVESQLGLKKKCNVMGAGTLRGTWGQCGLLLAGCLPSQQHASVSQGRICSDNFTCCHTEIEVTDQTFHLTQSQYTDTGPTSPSADPVTPGA